MRLQETVTFVNEDNCMMHMSEPNFTRWQLFRRQLKLQKYWIQERWHALRSW